MYPTGGNSKIAQPIADMDFLRLFLPYELRLIQRRAMTWGPDEAPPMAFLGLFLVRLEVASGNWFPAPDDGGAAIGDHASELLRSAVRDSDICARLDNQEHLAVVRDVDPEQAYVVAQRFLAKAGRSEILEGAGLHTRLGYVIYPLSPQPNLPTDQWSTLLELARRMGARGASSGPASGFGVLRGTEPGATDIPESDLIPLLFHDPDSLVKARVLRVQRIHILPGV
jgi:hypothetical protein